MSGLRNGKDGLFPKIKYQNYTLITLREINDSAGARGGQMQSCHESLENHPRHSCINNSWPSGEEIVYAVQDSFHLSHLGLPLPLDGIPYLCLLKGPDCILLCNSFLFLSMIFLLFLDYTLPCFPLTFSFINLLDL